MELAETASSSSVTAPSSSSSSNAVPAPKDPDPFSMANDPFSMVKVTKEICDSMSDLNDETLFKALEKLETLEWRQVFIALPPEDRRGWIEFLASLP